LLDREVRVGLTGQGVRRARQRQGSGENSRQYDLSRNRGERIPTAPSRQPLHGAPAVPLCIRNGTLSAEGTLNNAAKVTHTATGGEIEFVQAGAVMLMEVKGRRCDL
jgi:hypothetical protein